MRVFDRPGVGGRTRILILGAAHYPFAQVDKLRVPKLPDISSAAKSAVDFATRCIADWQDAFARPIASVDLLVNDAAAPDGIAFTLPAGSPFQLEAPTLANIKAARRQWMDGAGPDDLLLFYCCGHGVWLPSVSRTFLASDFGVDEDEPWSNAIALDDFRLALGDHPPRTQWLLFDCCANTPTEALEALRARANPLLQPQAGARGVMEQLHGSLSQVAVAAASTGAPAFGKPGRASRFMEVLIEAFDNAGFRTQGDDGRWWLDQMGLESAMSSYALRIAPPQEEAYFTFARLTETDAPETPKLLGRAAPPTCTLLVSSDPSQRLQQCNLAIRTGNPAQFVAGQAAGPAALTRFRHDVTPFLTYDIEATFAGGSQTQSSLEIPDLPHGNLTIVATRPSGEQLFSPVTTKDARLEAHLLVPGRSPHEFMADATALGLVRPQPPETAREYLDLAPERSSTLLLSTVGGTAGRNLAALGVSPVFASRSVAAFDGGLFLKSGATIYDTLPDYHTLACWDWRDGRWGRTTLRRHALHAGSAYLQLQLGETDTPMAVGLLDALGYGPIVIVPPFRRGIDITFLAEGLQTAVFGRRVENPSAIRTPVALAVPRDRGLADLLVALSSPAMPQASQLWDQVAAAHGSSADSAHAFLVDKYKDPTAATLGALFLARFAPGRIPVEWLHNLDRVAGAVADNAYLLAWAAMTRPSDRPASAAAIRNLIRTAQKRPLLYFSRTRAQLVQAARLYGPWTRSRRLDLKSPRHPRQGDFLDYAADAGGLEAFWGASPSRPGAMPGELPGDRPRRNDEVRVSLVDGVFALR